MQQFVQPVSVYSTEVVTGFKRESTWEKNPPQTPLEKEGPKTRHPKAIPLARFLTRSNTSEEAELKPEMSQGDRETH